MSRLQHIGWFLARGFGPHGWGQPYQRWNYDWRRPDLYQQSIRTLEQAGLDLLIIEDSISLGNPETLDTRIRHAFGGPKLDPLLLAPYLFAATQNIGVVPTVNAGITPPYLGARQFASLQHLSGHRLGVNVVTDVGSARHAGLAPIGHDAAYDRAEEWIGSIRALWRSWDDGALIADADSGRFADGARLRPVRHRGEHFTLDGPLNAVPFDDGEPLIVSPGGSGRGLAFAGAHSDVQLALAPLDSDSVRDYRARIHAAAEAAGRSAGDIRILFAVQPLLVDSAEEADRVVSASARSDEAALRAIAEKQSSDLETDLTALDLDAPLPPGIFGDHVSHGSIARLLRGADAATTPLREILGAGARQGLLRDGTGFVGTADDLADTIERLADEADNDGVLLWGDLHPVTVHRTLDRLVPILRRRGLLREAFGDGGLRANLFDF